MLRRFWWSGYWILALGVCLLATIVFYEPEESHAVASEYGPPVRVVRALGDDVRTPDECFRTRSGVDLCMWDDDSGAHVVVLDHAARI